MISSVVFFIKRSIRFLSNLRMYYICRKYIRHLLEVNGFDARKASGEDKYKRVWHQLSNRVEPYSYRLFRNYCGDNPYIIPEDIGHTIIEMILNPLQYRAVYTDKNMFPLIVGKENVPKTVICRIGGGQLLDGNYNVISDDEANRLIEKYDSLIIKPSVGGSSGRGVEIFVKGENGEYTPSISVSYLKKYGENFCLQETVEQSTFMKSFCKTAVNTIRLVTYRSVKNDKVKLTAAVMRIGKEGSSTDNTHSGGKYVGVDIHTGQLGHVLYTLERSRFTETWNNVDFKNNTFTIPNWEKIEEFAIGIGKQVLHHRLLALDVALDKSNQPTLIEYNIGGFSYGLFLSTSQDIFDGETQDVIDYCKLYKKRLIY